MAKNTTKVQDGQTDTTATLTYIETTEPTVRLPWSGEAVGVASIHPQGIAYLIQYGVNKTTQDAASGLLAKVKELHSAMHDGKATDAQKKAFAKYAADVGMSVAGAMGMDGEEFSRTVVAKVSADRWAEVISGKMDIPGTGNRLTGISRIVRDLSENVIKARAKARGMKVTEEQVRTLAEQFMAAGSDEAKAIEAEAQRRMDSEAALAKGTTGGSPSDDVMSLLNG